MKSIFLVRRFRGAWIFLLALSSLTLPAQATNLVTNGSFELTTNGPGQLGYNTNVTGWTNNTDGGGNIGYNFLFASGTSDSGGSSGNSGNVKLWGPKDGSANGLPASSPDGGNFLGMDGAYQVGALTQTITLSPTLSTYVSFYFAGAQQSGFDGATTEQFQVSLGGKTQLTEVLNNVNHGFTGWRQETLTFAPTNLTSAVLSFLAIGTPGGVPPFSLLDGVVVTQTPEPATWSMITGALLVFGVAAFQRRRAVRSTKVSL